MHFFNFLIDTVFILHPKSVNSVIGEDITVICSAQNSSYLKFLVNGYSADQTELKMTGFIEGQFEEGDIARRNLTVRVSLEHNNTNISCVAIDDDGKHSMSDSSLLLVQGKL